MIYYCDSYLIYPYSCLSLATFLFSIYASIVSCTKRCNGKNMDLAGQLGDSCLPIQNLSWFVLWAQIWCYFSKYHIYTCFLILGRSFFINAMNPNLRTNWGYEFFKSIYFENFFHGLDRSEIFLAQSGTCTEIIVLWIKKKEETWIEMLFEENFARPILGIWILCLPVFISWKKKDVLFWGSLFSEPYTYSCFARLIYFWTERGDEWWWLKV